MNKAFFVSVLQTRGGLEDVFDGATTGHRAAAIDDLIQRLAFDVFHHEEVHVPLLGDIKNPHDVGVIECRSRTGFPQEPLHGHFVHPVVG